MSYLEYVVAAYAVFVVVMAWELVSPHLQIRRELRSARQRAVRQAARPGKAPHSVSSELSR